MNARQQIKELAKILGEDEMIVISREKEGIEPMAENLGKNQ